MAHRAHGDNDPDVRIELEQLASDVFIGFDHLLHREHFFAEFGSRHLVAVGHHASLAFVHHGRAKGNDEPMGPAEGY